MNKRIIKCALLLALCAVNVKGWAQDSETVIFSENFSGFTKGNPNQTFTSNGWTYTDCEYNTNVNSLQMKNGSLTSPKVSISHAFTISFEYANGNKSEQDQDLSATFAVTGDNIQIYSETVTPTNHVASKFLTKTITIEHGAEDIQITISKTGKNGLYLKNFQISTSTYTLSESWDNSYAISAQSGNSVDVTLGRTFAAGIWNTLCLPFDVTTESVKTAFRQTENPQLREFSSVENNSMKFTAPTGTVAAGTPFLLKLSAAPASAITFTGVTINSSASTVATHDGFSFTGVYSPTVIENTNYFLKADGKLYRPNGEGGNTLAGLRAYFTIPTSLVSSGTRPLISIDADGTATGISPSTIHQNLSTRYYTLSGRPITTPTASGIYIVRQADGTTRKIIKN